MPNWGSYSFLFGPFVALLAVGVLTLALVWSSSRGRSVVHKPGRPGKETDYGLLRPVASPSTVIEAEVIRLRLEAEGLRATVAHTSDGPRVMVFSRDTDVAASILQR